MVPTRQYRTAHSPLGHIVLRSRSHGTAPPGHMRDLENSYDLDGSQPSPAREEPSTLREEPLPIREEPPLSLREGPRSAATSPAMRSTSTGMPLRSATASAVRSTWYEARGDRTRDGKETGHQSVGRKGNRKTEGRKGRRYDRGQ
eukprot:403653-Rhodomonas_salina.5